jgi:hypothetical protein
MKKYFIIALAALGFAACAEKINDGQSPEQTGELEQSYIAINLMSSDLDTRADDPVLEDGEEAERKVNSVHFFFFRQGVPIAVNAAGSAPGGDRNWLYATTPGFSEDLDKDNISAYSNVMLVLNNYKGQYPDQIVAVINWTPDKNVYKLDELHAKLVGLQSNEGGFVMSNSVYKSGENVIDATAISEPYETAAEAESHPVDIYVERVAAKVKVSTPESTIEGKWDATNKWFDTGKTSNLTTLGESQNKVYVKIQNWSLYNARTQSMLLKSIDPTWTDDALGLTWNDSPRFRSYWAAADTYTDSPDDYIKGNFESEIRNATISKILYLNGSIEQFGSGFKRINSLCRDSGIKYSYENTKNGFKFIIYRPVIQSDNPSVTLDVTLNGTEMSVLAILKQKPDSSREEIANRISKTVRTVQRALNSLGEKGYIVRIGSKQIPKWRVLK